MSQKSEDQIIKSPFVHPHQAQKNSFFQTWSVDGEGLDAPI